MDDKTMDKNVAPAPDRLIPVIGTIGENEKPTAALAEAAPSPAGNDAMREAVQALFQPWPKDEMGPSDEPESQYRFGYNTALEDVLEALAAPAQSEAKPVAAKYFVYCPEGGYNEYATDEERQTGHERAIGYHLDDGWSESVDQVVSGIVTHHTVQTNLQHKPEPCSEHEEHDGDDCEACDEFNEWPDHCYDTSCNYEPEAITAPPASDAQGEAKPDDGYKDLYVELHKTLGPAIDYVQSHQSEFGIGLGEDTIPHIVKAFLDSRAPAGDGGDAAKNLRQLVDTFKTGIVLVKVSDLRELLAARHAPTGPDDRYPKRASTGP